MALSLSAALSTGCGKPPDSAARAPSAAPAVDAPDVVATVDGRPIRAADVEAQARATGVTARAALDQLIEAEVLVAEATRRGLRSDEEVREAAAAVMVRRWLAASFEKEVTPQAVTEREIAAAYARNAEELDRPELRFVAHVLAPFGAPPPDPVRRQQLLERAEQVRARAAGVRSAADFLALAPALSDGAVQLKGEELATGAVGYTVRPFADAAFALRKPGDVSGVVETRFGFHVIYLKEILPPRHIPLDDVRDKLRAGLWPEVRRREFARFVDGLTEHHKVELHPGLLGDEAGAAPAPRATDRGP